MLIDGQYLYHAARRLIDAAVHPILIARHLAGSRELTKVRYHNGLHDRDANRRAYDHVRDRHRLMRKCGVEVVEHPLSYRWLWEVDAKALPAPNSASSGWRSAQARPARIAREPSIPAALVLDAVEIAAQAGPPSSLIVVSGATIIRRLAEILRPLAAVALELAVVGSGGLRRRPSLQWAAFHMLDNHVLTACRDDVDYLSRGRGPSPSDFLRKHRLRPA